MELCRTALFFKDVIFLVDGDGWFGVGIGGFCELRPEIDRDVARAIKDTLATMV
jgi:hypothetical protein